MSYVGERPWWPIQSPSSGRKKKVERLRGEGDNIQFIDPRFEKRQVVGFGQGIRRQDVP